MAVFQLPQITRRYECSSIVKVQKIVESASNLEASRITVQPHPDSIKMLWTWTVTVEIAGDKEAS